MKRITNEKKKKGRCAESLACCCCWAVHRRQLPNFPFLHRHRLLVHGGFGPTLSGDPVRQCLDHLSATTNHPNPLYPLLRFTTSNSAPLYPFYGANYTINSTQNTIIIPLRYRRGQLGTVQVSPPS